PAWLLLMTLLLAVKVQGTLTVFSKTTTPPSAVAVLLVMTTLLSVRLALPTSRMPPPLALGPSGVFMSVANPFWMVKPVNVTRSFGVGWLGSKLGLMSKTRLKWLPSTTTLPPLVFWMVRLPAVGRMLNSPAWLSVSPAIPWIVIV